MLCASMWAYSVNTGWFSKPKSWRIATAMPYGSFSLVGSKLNNPQPAQMTVPDPAATIGVPGGASTSMPAWMFMAPKYVEP